MCALLLVLFLCFSSIEGQISILRKSKAEVNEFEPLALMCDTNQPFFRVHEIVWIRNNKTEWISDRYCSHQKESVHYNISCLPYRQYNLTINNVTRFNHGDRWHCRGDNYFQSNDVQVLVKVPISNITLLTEDSYLAVPENKSARLQCVCHGGIPAGQIMWLHDNGTPNDVSDDVVIPENNNETITHKDNTIATKSNVTFKAVAAHIGTSVYCKATNNNVNWLYSKFILITVLLPSSSVEITQPRTASVTAYEKEKCLFECVTSPGLPASTITWYKITNGSEVVLIANGSSITKLNNKTIVSRSWLSLAFSIAEDWTYVYCTANNSVRTLTSRQRNDDSTLAKAAIGLSSVIGTSFVFLIVGYCMIKKIRSLK
ncbi:hypothetical protein MAR_031806, partial [Mya arenaria]